MWIIENSMEVHELVRINLGTLLHIIFLHYTPIPYDKLKEEINILINSESV